MKKSTKLITTAVALALVVAAMVVGIYAATAGSATVTASVSWEATSGINFTLQGAVYNRAGEYSYSEINKFTQIKVDNSTTNQNASSSDPGMQRQLNANFIDDTNDGVNNPGKLYYVYHIFNSGTTVINLNVTQYPVSNENIKVEYAWSNFAGLDSMAIGEAFLNNAFSSNPTTTKQIQPISSMPPGQFIIELTVLTPDVSITNFDASVSFSFAKA